MEGSYQGQIVEIKLVELVNLENDLYTNKCRGRNIKHKTLVKL